MELETGSSSQGTTTTEVQSTPAPQSQAPTPQTLASPGAPSPQTPGTPGAPNAQVTPPAPYTPNFKYKAGGQDKELPDWIRGAIKDAEHEKYLRELHEKMDGFDKLKGTHQKLDEQYKQIFPEYSKFKGTIDKVVKLRNAGDLEGVFTSIGIPEQAVAQWMLKKIQMQEMAPEQRQVYEEQTRLQRENMALQDQIANLSQGQEMRELQTRATSLQSELAKPEVVQIAESFNARLGSPDAFWNFVCQQADFMERGAGGKPVTANQAIQECIRLLGTPIQPGQAQIGGNQNPAQGAASPTPPIIPNVGSRNTSPTKKLARSIDDIRKLSKEMSGQTA